MNKFILNILFLFICVVFSSTCSFAMDNIDNQVDVYSDSDVYILPQKQSQEENMFMPVELDLTDYSYMNDKSVKKLEAHVEKTDKPKVTKIKGGIWDDSKLYRYNFYSDETNLRVLPSYGSLGSYVSVPLDDKTSIMVGQDGFTSFKNMDLQFAYTNASYYSVGGRIDGSTDKFDYSVGAFTETDTNNNLFAAAISTKPVSLFNSKGKFSVGAAALSSDLKDDNKNTTGLFARYDRGRMSLATQVAQTSYSSGRGDIRTSVNLLPTFYVNDHLRIKTKLVKNFEIDELQGEIGLSVHPLKDIDRFSFDVSASNYQSQNVITRQRLKFSTEFNF